MYANNCAISKNVITSLKYSFTPGRHGFKLKIGKLINLAKVFKLKINDPVSFDFYTILWALS